ncbi:MAG: phosphate acyltransferase, partial [bacterium]
MNLQKLLKNEAKNINKKIVLPEGNESRILKAAEKIVKQNIAEIIILGDKKQVQKDAEKNGVDLEKIEIINPESSELRDEFAQTLLELRKHKGLSMDEATQTIIKPLYFGTLLVHTDRVDGMVAGSINLTGDVLRPAFQILKTK